MKCYTYEERPELVEQVDVFIPQAWPRFMLNDPVAGRLWGRLEGDFAAFQFTLCEDGDRVAAMGNTIPFAWDGAPASLPMRGWDGIFEQAVQDRDQGRPANALSALQAVVRPGHQGQGLSRLIVETMRAIAARHGLAHFVAPVRPSLKSAYPLTPMERYAAWTQPDGSPFDPWLRVHWRQGARVLFVAPRSMVISGTLERWESWTGMKFPDSGEYIVPGGLCPVTIDCERDEGVYVEPNVWMQHPDVCEG